MTLEKQPDWIADFMADLYTQRTLDNICLTDFTNTLMRYLPQEDTYQKGYQEGRKDMKKKIKEYISPKIKVIKIENDDIGCLSIELAIDAIKSLLSTTDTK